jgi:hypothetical protein
MRALREADMISQDLNMLACTRAREELRFA